MSLFSGCNNMVLPLILLFIFTGGDTFDTTQLLLTLALFSTIDEDTLCPNNITTSTV